MIGGEALQAPGPIELRLNPTTSGVGFGHRLAGRRLMTDLSLPSLGAPREFEHATPLVAVRGVGDAHLAFEGEAWLGGRMRRLVAHWRGAVAEVEIEPEVVWQIDRARWRALLLATGTPAESRGALEEMALGPPLLLLLAARGLAAIHASAALVDGKLVLFSGDSGAGKSTFAAQPPWVRMADDLVPIENLGGLILAHLDYPQLKLRPMRRSVAPIPLAGFVLLAGPGSAESPTLDRLTGREAAEALLAQTMSSRLYDDELLSAHFELCLATAQRIPAYRLALPRDLLRISEGVDLVQRALRQRE